MEKEYLREGTFLQRKQGKRTAKGGVFLLHERGGEDSRGIDVEIKSQKSIIQCQGNREGGKCGGGGGGVLQGWGWGGGGVGGGVGGV